MDLSENYQLIQQVIAQRKTSKILTNVENPVAIPDAICETIDAIVKTAIADAGLAPFHYDRNFDQTAEPWRVHWIGHSTCRQISQQLSKWFELKPSNKLPAMLAACGSLVLVNWLPQFRMGYSDERLPALNQLNEQPLPEKKMAIDDEHLAATASYVQNLLLLLTAAGLGTYWSSGGQLALPTTFERLDISNKEKLLAAVFVDYLPLMDSMPDSILRIGGKNHDRRSTVQQWAEFRDSRLK